VDCRARDVTLSDPDRSLDHVASRARAVSDVGGNTGRAPNPPVTRTRPRHAQRDDPDARTIASAEACVDPLFLFDQSAFDAQHLPDPTRADIQLADYFTFRMSSNTGAAAGIIALAGAGCRFARDGEKAAWLTR